MTCPACGAENKAGRKFCSRCGAALARACPACGAANDPEDSFCGECGSALAAEETRELLSRYFETCRRLVSLYGGTVEKFIGDAVMAVWGAPVATEDDAERAVRAALE